LRTVTIPQKSLFLQTEFWNLSDLHHDFQIYKQVYYLIFPPVCIFYSLQLFDYQEIAWNSFTDILPKKINMRFSLFQGLFLVCVVLLSSCQQKTDYVTQFPPLPERNGPSDEDNASLSDSLKKEYWANLYHADPWVDVEAIRAANYRRNLARKQTLRAQAGLRSVTENFANNKVSGAWHERGPNNEAGDMREAFYEPTTGDLYATSVGGALWKGDLGGNWELMDDSRRFRGGVLHRVPNGGSTRMFTCHGTGKGNKIVQFTDDEGATWTEGTGMTFYDHWGEGAEFVNFSDPNVLFYLVHTWSGSPWGQKIVLYMSTDMGVSYTSVWDSGVGYASRTVDLWKPANEDKLYLFDNIAQNYYEVTYDSNTQSAVMTAPASYTSANLATGSMSVTGKYNTSSLDYDLYLITNSDKKVYKTTNGTSFTLLGTSTETVWRKAFLVDPNNNNIYVGGFEMSKSTDGGASWSDLYGAWSDYYNQSKDSLHVDQMNLKAYETSDGTPFLLSLNHGGVFISYDGFLNSENIGISDLRATTLYDQTTANDGFLYCGAQDKGTFVIGGTTSDFSLVNTDNHTTGDGMVGSFFNSDQSILAMLQNSLFAVIANRDVRSPSYHEIPGNHRPGWITPMVSTPDFADNKVYIAGGNINGGDGCYLIEMEVTINGNSGTPNPMQLNYDFRANSNDGDAVIKAIGVAQSDFDRLYVATEDGTFFYSTNKGVTWTKSAVSLPNAFIPWEIITSDTNADEVFISGTGNSNTGVYHSTDGGVTFTPLSTNIPSATIYEVALNDTDQLLFAATSDGPYVYVFEDAQWYSLMGADTPIVDYNSVDNIGNNVMRFGTYGRGVWDFEIQSLALPADLIVFDANNEDNKTVQIEWTTAQEINLVNFEIQYATGNSDFKTLEKIEALGDDQTENDYAYLHKNPIIGENYYRLKMNDSDGTFDFSEIRSVELKAGDDDMILYPNPLALNESLRFRTEFSEVFKVELFAIDGRLVFVQNEVRAESTLSPNLEAGTYFYRVSLGERILKGGQLVIK